MTLESIFKHLKLNLIEGSKKCLFIMFLLSIQISGLHAQQPNIIIIYSDDMGLGDVSFANGQVYNTPNIDRLAKTGKVFTQYYTPAPVCSPSRVNLITGMYHIRWNVNTFLSTRDANYSRVQQDFLSSNAPTIAKTLKSAGYKTAHIGKWHLGGGRDVTNAPSITKYGFDEYVSTYESPDPDPAITSTNWIWARTDSIKRWDRTAYFVDKTIDFLKRNPDKPCFINLWPDDVHTPWVPSKNTTSSNYVNFKELKLVLDEYDKQIGRLLDSLEIMGIMDNTMIIFTSDNGPSPTFNHLRSNGKRGQKNSIYEGGVNMPFVICWPNEIEAGQIDETSIISSLDLFPTICKIAGTKYPLEFKSDGEDISDCILNNSVYERQQDLFFEYGRNPDFIFPKGANKSLQLGIRHDNWKLYSSKDGSTTELYDLSIDPNETNDLSTSKSELVLSLKTKLIEWYNSNDMEYKETVKSVPNPTTKELVFYFPFDRSFEDFSGNNYNLNNFNDVPLVSGKYGKAARFNGKNQFLDLDFTNILNPSIESFSICTWIRCDADIPSSKASHTIIGQKDNDGLGRIIAELNIFNDSTQTFGNNLGGISNATNKLPLTKGEWIHLTLTFDQRYDSINYYVNGLQVMKSEVVNFENCTGGFKIGATKRNSNFWKGELDEMFLFKGILNKNEIDDVMSNLVGEEINKNTIFLNNQNDDNSFYVTYDEEARLLSFKYHKPINELMIYTTSGKKIVTTDKIWPINTSQMSPGFYIVKMIDSNGESFYRKIRIN